VSQNEKAALDHDWHMSILQKALKKFSLHLYVQKNAFKKIAIALEKG
jgi:hypothetical protein